MSRDAVKASDIWMQDEIVLPICLCLDTSGSMGYTVGGRLTGEHAVVEGVSRPVVEGGISRIEILQECLDKFCRAVCEDELARVTAVVSIVAFDDRAKLIQSFLPMTDAGEMRKFPKLVPEGMTAMGEGVNLALDLLEQFCRRYRKKGIDYYRPWLVIMSDGQNNGDKEEFRRAENRIRKLVKEKRLSVYAFGIGKNSSLEQMYALSPEQQAFRLEPEQIEGLFDWLAKSVVEVSSGSMDSYKSPKLEKYKVVEWTKKIMMESQ